MSTFTAFGTADNIPSYWPAGVNYDPNSSKYVYSISNAYQIAALQHIHVVDIDLPQIGFVPNVMSLTLPIMKNLPLESRFYYFYVTQANPNDELTFLPVALSGNTINGNAVSYTFTLSGEPQLFIAIGVRDNYIIHAFGRNNIGPDAEEIPTQQFTYLSDSEGVSGLTSFGSNLIGYTTKDIACDDNLVGPNNIVTGMEGFLTLNSAIPTQGYKGWLCNHDGYYIVNPEIEVNVQVTATSTLGPLWSNFYEFNADGSFSSAIRAPSFLPPLAGISPGTFDYGFVMNSSFLIPMHAGKFYVPTFTYDVANTSAVNVAEVNGSIYFVYWAPLPPPELELALRSAAPSVSAARVQSANSNPAIFAPMSKSLAGPAAVAIQKSRMISQSQASRRGDLPSPSSAQPMFSLSDMERMINQALDARDARAVIPAPSLLSSSSSSSSAPPDAKKRKISFAKK